MSPSSFRPPTIDAAIDAAIDPAIDPTIDLGVGDGAAGRLRLDKWLWYARFVKTRSLGTKLCGAGVIRCAGAVVVKANHAVKPGDVLTFPLGNHIRVVRVLALGERRGPAPQARLLYEDLAPPDPENRLPRL